MNYNLDHDHLIYFPGQDQAARLFQDQFEPLDRSGRDLGIIKALQSFISIQKIEYKKWNRLIFISILKKNEA